MRSPEVGANAILRSILTVPRRFAGTRSSWRDDVLRGVGSSTGSSTTGTGIYLATDTPTPEQVRDAVDQILAKPEYRACAQELAREFASFDSAVRLTELVEAVVAEREVLIG
jgi:hypothetical protein